MPDAGPFALLLLPPFGWIFAGVFGAVWGSFFNVAIHRLAREDARLRDVVWPPSHCPHCKHRIRARDNLPVVGWLLLRGRCRDCGAPIPARYPLVELLGAVAGLAVYWGFVLGQPDGVAAMYARFFVYFFFTGTLLVLAIIDLDTMLLPEAITEPAIPAFMLLAQILGDVPLREAVVGALVGFFALKLLQWGYAAATGREGLGGGDAMLMALVGGFLGWRALPFTLGIGSLLGSLILVPLLLVRRAGGKRADAAAQRSGAPASSDAAQPGDTAPQHDASAAPSLYDAASQHDASAAPSSHDAASQHDAPAAPRSRDAASQHDATILLPPSDAESRLSDDSGAPASIRHVEVPFGPFLVAGALLYMFLREPVLQLFLAWADRP